MSVINEKGKKISNKKEKLDVIKKKNLNFLEKGTMVQTMKIMKKMKILKILKIMKMRKMMIIMLRKIMKRKIWRMEKIKKRNQK